MRIVALDLIRFFAAMSVVLYHYVSRKDSHPFPLLSEVTNYGYLGVPLFFMISGYVIALSANNRTAIQFAVSRFVRLYPALWACALFTVLVVTLYTDKHFPLSQILANFTLVNEYMGFKDIDGVYWTLKIELKFYACVFLMITFGVFHSYRIWLSIWLAMTIMFTAIKQPFFMGWFISPEYSSFFIAGVACFLIQTRGKNVFNHLILFISLILSSYLAYGQAEQFMDSPSSGEQAMAVVGIWLFYGLLYLLCTGHLALQKRNVYLTLGALTYPLYLIHSKAGKTIIDHYSDQVPEQAMVILVILLMLFVSWLINVLVERPLATPLKNYLLRMVSSTSSVTGRFSRAEKSTD